MDSQTSLCNLACILGIFDFFICMNAQDIDWRDLQLVLAICRNGTLSGAARELGINHSTVFRRLNAIESRLDVRLFERLPTGYAMTAAGETMQASAERIEAEIFGLSRHLIGGDLRLSGTLRVTAPDALAVHILMPQIASFRQRYPGIEIELSIDNGFLDLSQRQADVAVRTTDTPPEASIARRLCRLGATFYSSNRYLGTHTEADVSGYDWLMPASGLVWFSANQWLAHTYPQARVALRSNSLLSLYAAVNQDMGIAPLPFFLGDPARGLRRVLEPPPAFASELWLLTHPDLRRTARVRAFVEYLSAALEPLTAQLEGR